MVLKQIDELTKKDIAGICDHTFLDRSECYKEKSKQTGKSCMELREKEFWNFLDETIKLDPYAVCVRPEDVSRASLKLGMKSTTSKPIQLASVVGFPDGSWYGTESKVAETAIAIENGANEIDVVLNYRLLNQRLCSEARNEIIKVVRCADQEGVLVKLIFETSELSPGRIIDACNLAGECGVDFIKTSTGFGKYGARVEDLKIMRENFKEGIKISGGVNPDNYKELLMAASWRKDDYIDLDPLKIRIGESSLLSKL